MPGSDATDGLPEMYATRGFLGQGRYLKESMQKPGTYRIQVPAYLVLQLMHCGRWRRLAALAPTSLQKATSPYPDNNEEGSLNTTQDCTWHANADDIAAAIEKLQQQRHDPLCFRLQRILQSLLVAS